MTSTTNPNQLPLPSNAGSIASRSRRSSWSDARKAWNATDDDVNYSDSHTIILKKLDGFYRKVKRQILAFQSVTTGLFPNHLETNTKTAHVLENVFCAIAVWSLRQCYTKIDNDQGRAHELGQAAVKCMRGILSCWMKQSHKVEIFKSEQSPTDALHSKFNVFDGSEIQQADEVGQLQICAVSIYLLTLVQMITSDLQIIFSLDEVNFVQQLVYYIERAYRTPDYGIWERGSKYNTNTCELHASSIGMAKAALEAMNGFNLYGDKGSSWSVVYVDVDAHNRNRTTFDTLLPRESASKNTDAALLMTVGWPTFAIHDATLVDVTIRKCIRKLRGTHGFKRFLRDGQFTDLETKDQRFYHETEIKKFDKNECEWPMFFALMVIDGIFKNDQKQIDEYLSALNPLLRRTTEGKNDDVKGQTTDTSISNLLEIDLSKSREMMPHYYFLDHSKLMSSGQSESSDQHPEAQLQFQCSSEILNGNFFLLGQSIWIICQLLVEKLLSRTDLDPIRRCLAPSDRPKSNSRYSSIQDSSRYQYAPTITKSLTNPLPNVKKPTEAQNTFSDLVIQVVAISESIRLQQVLATYGIQTQTPKQVEPLLIWPPVELLTAYANLGTNPKLGCSGRPKRPIGVLGTCKVYRICSRTVLCYPLTFETTDFYVSSDMTLLLDNIRSDLEFITKCWRLRGRPIYVMMLRERYLRGPQKSDLLELLTQIRQGKLSSNVFVRLERLQTAISSACVEHLDFLSSTTCPDFRWELVAVTEQKSGNESSHYKSLTDVTKATIIGEDIDYRNHEFQHQSDYEIREFINNNDVALGSLRRHALATYEMTKRSGLDGMIRDQYTVRDHLHFLMKEGGTWQHWAVIRFVSSLLHKMIDSLAPSVTNLLVRGKIVTIGVFGFEEAVIDKPKRPNEIYQILYGPNVFGQNIFHSVLLQELLINISVFMSTFPNFFNGILKIRLGWILEAMKLGLEYAKADAEDVMSLNIMSPNDIKQLLYYVLTSDLQQPQSTQITGDIEARSPVQRRQMDGALSRVPPNFFENVWYILERTPGGLRLCNIFLPQQPTLSDMTDYELNFSLKIEDMLSRIGDPAYRCLVVEMFEAINVLLKRNNELRFIQPLDIDYLLNEAVKLFEQQTNTKEPYRDFYNLPMTLVRGSTGYMIRAIINHLFNANVQKSDVIDVNFDTGTDGCKIS